MAKVYRATRMSDILNKILAVKSQEVAAALSAKPLPVIRAEAEQAAAPRDFVGAIRSKIAAGKSAVENAHEFRLTPWHNDPVTDSCGEA